MLKLFPWDNGEKPFWINLKNGLEWYVDKDTTKWCGTGNMPKLEAVVFFVVERKGDKVEPISRVLICKETNNVLADETSLEAMACKIDMLRLIKSHN